MHFPPDSGMADFSQHGRARAASARPWRSRRLGNLPKSSYQGLTLAYIRTDSLLKSVYLVGPGEPGQRREQTKVVAAPYRVCACNARGGEITDREHASDGTSYFSLSSRISSRARRPGSRRMTISPRTANSKGPGNPAPHASMRLRVFQESCRLPLSPPDRSIKYVAVHNHMFLSPGRQQG